jgi:hypothetical protein
MPMRPLLLFFGWLLLIQAALPQPPLVVQEAVTGSQLVDITPYTWFYEDRSGDTLPLSQIRTMPFRPFAGKRNERANESDLSRMVIWLRFSIRNAHPTDTLLLYHEVWAHNDIATYENGRLINRVGIGVSGGVGLHQTPRRPIRFDTRLTIPPGVQNTYYVRIIDYLLAVTPVTSHLVGEQGHWEQNYETAIGLQPLMTLMCVLMGSLLFMSIYAAYSFLLTRDKAFLYYFCYTFTAGLLCFHNIDSRFGLGWVRWSSLPCHLRWKW